METYKNILKVTSLFGTVYGLKIVLNIVRTKIAALLLGPTGIGLNSIYNETRELLHTTTNLGLDVSGIRGISRRYEEWRNAQEESEKTQIKAQMEGEISLLRSWVLLLALVGTLVCMLLAEPLSYFTLHDYDHVWAYVMLAPAVGLSTIVCGEMTILKATRRIALVAALSVFFVILAIIISLPLYYCWGMDGIIPALILLCLGEAVLVIAVSYRRYRPRFSFSRKDLRSGIPALQLGIAFALSGMFTHGTQLAIKSFFGDPAITGLYSAGYTTMATVGSIVFASLDSDFYPRLAGIFSNINERRTTVFRQIRVAFSMILVVALFVIFFLPYLIPILYSDDFSPIVPMTQIAMVSLMFRAFYLPFSILNLAAGASRLYLILEIVSNAIIIACVLPAYHWFGLTGIGLGILVAQIIDTIISFIVAKVKYGI